MTRRVDKQHRETAGANRLLAMPEPSTLYVNTEEGVSEVQIFLDQRLIDQLSHYEVSAWRGLIEYVEGDIRDQNA